MRKRIQIRTTTEGCSLPLSLQKQGCHNFWPHSVKKMATMVTFQFFHITQAFSFALFQPQFSNLQKSTSISTDCLRKLSLFNFLILVPKLFLLLFSSHSCMINFGNYAVTGCSVGAIRQTSKHCPCGRVHTPVVT